jgi:hypothetical protein
MGKSTNTWAPTPTFPSHKIPHAPNIPGCTQLHVPVFYLYLQHLDWPASLWCNMDFIRHRLDTEHFNLVPGTLDIGSMHIYSSLAKVWSSDCSKGKRGPSLHWLVSGAQSSCTPIYWSWFKFIKFLLNPSCMGGQRAVRKMENGFWTWWNRWSMEGDRHRHRWRECVHCRLFVQYLMDSSAGVRY